MGANVEATRNRLRNLERSDIVTPPFSGVQRGLASPRLPGGNWGCSMEPRFLRLVAQKICPTTSLSEKELRMQSKSSGKYDSSTGARGASTDRPAPHRPGPTCAPDNQRPTNDRGPSVNLERQVSSDSSGLCQQPCAPAGLPAPKCRADTESASRLEARRFQCFLPPVQCRYRS